MPAASSSVTLCSVVHFHFLAERWGAFSKLEGNMVPTAQLLLCAAWPLSTNPLQHSAGEWQNLRGRFTSTRTPAYLAVTAAF